MSRSRDLSNLITNALPSYLAYGQFNGTAAQTFAGNAFSKVILNEAVNNRNITISSNSLLFAQTGYYDLKFGLRFGTGSDDWTGCRLFGDNASRGSSFGTGNVVNDPGPVTFNFIAKIENSSATYDLQMFRNGATLATSNPVANAGKTYVLTINKIGEI
jgi:hypothetical protein